MASESLKMLVLKTSRLKKLAWVLSLVAQLPLRASLYLKTLTVLQQEFAHGDEKTKNRKAQWRRKQKDNGEKRSAA